MRHRSFFGLLLLCFILSGPAHVGAANWLDSGKNFLNKMLPSSSTGTSLSQQEIIEGLKNALEVGSDNVIRQVGRENGFFQDPKIHIPLPPRFQEAKSVLSRLQLAGLLDELETRLNRAAEQATPRTKEIFGQAIREMRFDDAMQIYKGPKDAATLYFKKKTSPALKEAVRPLIAQALQQAGAVQLYDQIIGKYAGLPFMPDLKGDLTNYVSDKTLAGIFTYLAEEEAAIRTDPTKRTTELLRKLFANQQH